MPRTLPELVFIAVRLTRLARTTLANVFKTVLIGTLSLIIQRPSVLTNVRRTRSQKTFLKDV